MSAPRAGSPITRPVLIASLVGGTLFQVPLTLLTAVSGGPYGVPFTVGVSPGLVFSATPASFNPLAFAMNVSVLAVVLIAIALGRHVWIAVSAAAGGLLFQVFAVVDRLQSLGIYKTDVWLPVPVAISEKSGGGIQGWALFIDGLVGCALLAAAAYVVSVLLGRGGSGRTPHAEDDAVVRSHTAGGASSGSQLAILLGAVGVSPRVAAVSAGGSIMYQLALTWFTACEPGHGRIYGGPIPVGSTSGCHVDGITLGGPHGVFSAEAFAANLLITAALFVLLAGGLRVGASVAAVIGGLALFLEAVIAHRLALVGEVEGLPIGVPLSIGAPDIAGINLAALLINSIVGATAFAAAVHTYALIRSVGLRRPQRVSQ